MTIETKSKNAIEIRGLRNRYSRFDLGPLDLDVPRGSIFGFVGPNGAGKSTTIDLLFGMGRGYRGSVSMLGLDHLRDEVAIKERTAYVSPELDFSRWGKISKAIRFVRGFYPETWDDDYCVRLLKAFRLSASDRIGTLSFGSRTKLSLILALARRPELLILDEPTTGLDALAKHELFSALLELVEDPNKTIFMSSHNLTDLERFADHVAIIDRGQILEAGRIDQVIDRFTIVDFSLASDAELDDLHGVTILSRQGEQVRAVVNLSAGGIDRIEEAGARDLHRSPVTLEELLVAILKE